MRKVLAVGHFLNADLQALADFVGRNLRATWLRPEDMVRYEHSVDILNCRDTNNCRHGGRCAALMAEVFK